jgi:hypothetical protein
MGKKSAFANLPGSGNHDHGKHLGEPIQSIRKYSFMVHNSIYNDTITKIQVVLRANRDRKKPLPNRIVKKCKRGGMHRCRAGGLVVSGLCFAFCRDRDKIL